MTHAEKGKSRSKNLAVAMALVAAIVCATAEARQPRGVPLVASVRNQAADT